MQESEFNNQLIPKEKWFKRNWKWAVPIGCLSFIGLFIVLLIGGAFWGISKVVNDNDVTSHAISIINHNPEVEQQLGTNIETDGIFSGNIAVSNDKGVVDISVPIKGSKGTGKALIKGKKEFDKWNYENISVYVDETKELIEIQKIKE